MIRQPISIVDSADEFGRSIHAFSSQCFDVTEPLSHLANCFFHGSIAQNDFDIALLVYKDNNWLLFTHLDHVKKFSKVGDSKESNTYKVLEEDHVKEICTASEFKLLSDLCGAAPYIIVQLENVYQCNETGIPGVVDEQEAMQILVKAHQKPEKSTKKRKRIDTHEQKQEKKQEQENKKLKIDLESSGEESEKELTLQDVLHGTDSESEAIVQEERHSFGTKMTILAQHDMLSLLYHEPEKFDAIRKFTATKKQNSAKKNRNEPDFKKNLIDTIAKAIQAMVTLEESRKSADPHRKNTYKLQPPLVEHKKLFPVLKSEHGFRFSLFEYQRRLLYWMLERERQTILYAAWPAKRLDESCDEKFDDLVVPTKVQVSSISASDRQFNLCNGSLTLTSSNPPKIRFMPRSDEFLTKFCEKTYPSIMAASHYPHQIQRVCRLLFSKEVLQDDLLTQGFENSEIVPTVFVENNSISLSDSDDDEKQEISGVNRWKQLDSTASAQLLNHRVICSASNNGNDQLADCHGNCKAMQDYRAQEKANLNDGTAQCPLTILIEGLLRSAQSTALKIRFKDGQRYARKLINSNPNLFRCGVSCGKTGCGKTTMKIALIYVSKLWEDAQPEAAREICRISNNFDALLPISRRPLKLSINAQTESLAASRQMLYYSNCTLVVCPEQVVEQWFLEFVKTIGSGTLKKRPANGKNRAVLNGGVFGEIIDDDDNILLNIAVVRDYSALRQVELSEIIERLDVLIVNQSLFRSTAYRENRKRNPVNAELDRLADIGARLFDRPNDHRWIYTAVRYEREKMAAAEAKLEQSMLNEQQQQYDFDSVPKPGFSMGRTLLHAVHWRRIIIDEAHLLSNHITPVERGVSALSADFTWCLTATANFHVRGSFYRHSCSNEGGYGTLLHISDIEDRKNMEFQTDYRAQFVQQCSATTSYEALPQLFLHRVPIHFTPEETAIYASLRSGIKYRMLQLLFCSHHMLHDQNWISKNLQIDEVSQPQNANGSQNGNVVGAMMTVGQVAASMQSARQTRIENFNREIIEFNENFSNSWLELMQDDSVAKELIQKARQAIEKEIQDENELAQNEPENSPSEKEEKLTRDYLGPITESMLESWQRDPQVRIAMNLARLENDLARRAISLRARYTSGVANTRLPIVRHREKTLAEFNFFHRIFERLGRPDEIVECPVCLSDDHTKQSIVLTVCGHEFCTECSKAMFKAKAQCAVCRRQLVVPRDLRLVDRINVAETTSSDLEKKSVQALPSSVLQTYGSKLATLVTLIEKILKRRDCRKIIVFAQFQRLLLLIAGVLQKNNVNFVVAKGSIRQCEKALRSFRHDQNVKLILLSSEKSISGVHLVEANHMIAVHPTLCSRGVDEEVATFMQAVARMRRLMQQNDCHVWQLVTENTIEEQLYMAQMALLRHKYAMDVGIHWNASLDEEEQCTTEVVTKETLQPTTAQEKSRQEVMNLLNGQEENIDKEEEEEIDILLKKTITDTQEKINSESDNEENVETIQVEEEKDSFSDWLSSGNYRKQKE